MKPTRLISLSVIVVLLSSFAGSTELTSGSCLDLKQSQSFHFEGVLTYEVFPGPPNFEDVREGDKPEPTYILQLKKPIASRETSSSTRRNKLIAFRFFRITRTKKIAHCGTNFDG